MDETETLLHENDNYKVIMLREDKREMHDSYEGKKIIGNFKVVHSRFGTIEQWCEGYPAALAVAEFFNRQLNDQTYMNGLGENYVDVAGSQEEIDNILDQLEKDKDDSGSLQ